MPFLIFLIQLEELVELELELEELELEELDELELEELELEELELIVVQPGGHTVLHTVRFGFFLFFFLSPFCPGHTIPCVAAFSGNT